MLHELNKRGIDVRGRSTGQVKTYCPKCAHTRKKKGDPSLSVDIDKGLWNCHHCGWAGSVIEYVRPEARPQVTQEGIMNYFRKRGINDETVLHFQISQGNEWMPQDQKNHTVICFNYFEDGELINIKFKTSDKKFKMVKDAMKIPYNLDSINDEYVIICEGEEECMVWHQVGYPSVVSCPNGASKNNNNLEWLDKVYDKFTNKIIYLATDNDEPGRKLREDLIRRFDSTDIRIIEYPLKDANDCLLEFGPQFLQKIFDEAKMLPVKEISGASEYYDIIKGYRDEGYPVGAKVNMFHTDRLLSWSRGELAVVTGIPGCFDKEQLVHTKRGVVPIGEITTEDMVLSYNEKKKINEWRQVLATPIHQTTPDRMFKIKLKDGTIIKVTENHEFYTGTEYVKIKDLLLPLLNG